MAAESELINVRTEGPSLDALVIGAGPTGLLMAIELATRGCQVRIIDMLAEPNLQTKASGIQAHSLEVLPENVVDKILSTSKHVAHVRLWENANQGEAQLVSELDFMAMQTSQAWKGMRSQMQWLTEKQLAEHLQSLPGPIPNKSMTIERATELVKFTEKSNCVECELFNASTGMTERVTTKFLLGGDGGRSTIRKQLGFTFEGETTAEYFVALHAQMENYCGSLDSMDVFFSKGDDPLAPGFMFCMPMPDDGFLIVGDLDAGQQKEWLTGQVDSHGLPLLKQPTEEDVCKIMRSRGCGPNLTMVPGTTKWLTSFRVSSRQADHYGKGRVYLAGDACHCHSPLGGQGMNMGFQDAKNLAWKVAYVATGQMDPKILSTYEAERQGIEQKICALIEKGQKVASNRNPVLFFMRGRGQRVAPILVGLNPGVLSYANQAAWNYQASPMSVEHWERPAPSFGSLCPAGGYRRQQNIFRWLGTRLRAGDSCPEATHDGTSINALCKQAGGGFTLLLFEGNAEDNAELAAHVAKVEILSVDGLAQLGQDLKKQPLLIGKVLVFPAGHEAQQAFGVKGQCLFLLRPDHHVALRSEPVRRGVVHRYFKQQCGMSVTEEHAPAGTALFDPLPATAWFAFLFLTLASWFATGRSDAIQWKVAFGFEAFVLAFIFWASRPPAPY